MNTQYMGSMDTELIGSVKTKFINTNIGRGLMNTNCVKTSTKN